MESIENFSSNIPAVPSDFSIVIMQNIANNDMVGFLNSLNAPDLNLNFRERMISPLQLSVRLNRDIMLGNLLNRNVDVMETYYGYNVYHLAAIENHANALHVLLKRGDAKMINTPDPLGNNIYHLACLCNSIDALTVMVRYKSKINMMKRNLAGLFPIDILLMKKQREMLDILLTEVPNNLLVKKNGEGQCAIHTAIQFKFLYGVQALITKGIDVNIPTAKGDYPVHITTVLGDMAILKEVLAGRAKVNARNAKGHKAIVYALEKGNNDMAKLLAVYDTLDNE